MIKHKCWFNKMVSLSVCHEENTRNIFISACYELLPYSDSFKRMLTITLSVSEKYWHCSLHLTTIYVPVSWPSAYQHIHLCICLVFSYNYHHELKILEAVTTRLSNRFVVPVSHSLIEHGRQAIHTGVQSGGGAEVSLHSAPLQRLQGPVGLADPAGYLLRCCHRPLQCQLHAARWLCHGCTLHHRQWHSSGDAFYHRWVV